MLGGAPVPVWFVAFVEALRLVPDLFVDREVCPVAPICNCFEPELQTLEEKVDDIAAAVRDRVACPAFADTSAASSLPGWIGPVAGAIAWQGVTWTGRRAWRYARDTVAGSSNALPVGRRERRRGGGVLC